MRTEPLVRGVLAGAAGTMAMSCGEVLHVWAHRRWWPDVRGPVDYDVSGHVVTAAARVLHIEVRSRRQARLLFLVTHFGYGSAFGVVGEALAAAGLPRRTRVLVFAGAAEGLACTLFPLLGDAPAPWAWPTEALVASVVEHVVYAAVAVVAGDELRW